MSVRNRAKKRDGRRAERRWVTRPAAGWAGRLAVLVPLLLAGAAYLPTLGYDFVWDDQNFIVDNPAAHSLGRLPEALGHGYGWVPSIAERPDAYLYFRPVIVAANTVQWVLSGGAPWLFHLMNLLTHALSAAVVSLILLRLGAHWSAALLAGGLFALHPIHSEAVAWISGRTDLCAGLFGLLALAWTAPRLAGERAWEASAPSLAAVGAATLLALFSKESAVAVALLLPALAFAAGRPAHDRANPAGSAAPGATRPGRTGRAQGRRAGRFYLTLGVVIVLYVVLRFAVLGENAAGGSAWRDAADLPARGSFGERLLLGGNLLIVYLQRLIIPWPLAMDPPAGLSAPPYPVAPGLAGLALLAALGCAFLMVILRPPARLGPGVTMGLGLLVLGLLPVLQIIPTGEVYGERFLYLPAAGFLIALASLTAGFWSARPGWAVSALMLIALPYLYLLESRLPDWRNEITLFSRAVEVHPESARSHANLGAALMEAHQHGPARLHLEEAVRLDPDDPLKRAQLGSLLINVGEVDRGMELLEGARNEGKVNKTMLLNLGIGHLRRGEADQAVAILEQAVRLDPRDPALLESLGSAERKRGRFDRAEALYRDALAIQPMRKSCYLNLFGMHYFDRRDLEAARYWGGEFLRRFPGAPEAEQTRRLMQRRPEPPGASP